MVANIIASRPYALVTYPDPTFSELSHQLAARAGAPAITINDVAPNPDFALLDKQSEDFGRSSIRPGLIVALGGGSVIDSAKVFAAAGGAFGKVKRYLESGEGGSELSAIPILAVPTTAGTGSEVTCWGTVWDKDTGRKFSLARPDLYPSHAVIDPELMLGMPRSLTIATGLDALSHALESIWNRNANPVSTNYAVAAAREILTVLPRLVNALDDVALRERMAKASLFAGLAFSNTKTAIAHSISYPVTLRHDVQHGIACSFTLPLITRSLAHSDLPCRQAMRAILGADLVEGAEHLQSFLEELGIATDPSSYGISPNEWTELVDLALTGERGQNFVGDGNALRSPDPFSRQSHRQVPAQ